MNQLSKHQAVDFTGKLGSVSDSEQIPQMIQCDADRVHVVSVLKYYVSKGVTEDGSMTAIAAQTVLSLCACENPTSQGFWIFPSLRARIHGGSVTSPAVLPVLTGWG
jgi:hypothetical protein